MTEERTCLHQQAVFQRATSELKQFQSRLSITSAGDPLVAQPALLQWCQRCKNRKEKINIQVQQIFILPELSSVLCVSPVIKMLLKTGCKLTAVRSLVEHCCCIAASPFPLLSHPEFRTVAGWYSGPSAVAATPRCDLCGGAQTQGNVWRPRKHVLLLDGAAPEYGVQLERTLQPFLSSHPALLLHPFNNSPHHTCSAAPVRKLARLPPVIVVPALLEVNIWTPEWRPRVRAETKVSVLHY